MEEDFPRGGGVKKSTEGKAAVQRAEVDNLFQSHEQTETKKRKGATQDGGKTSKKQKTANKKGDATILNAPAKCVEILHLKNLKEGMLILGCVKDVTDYDVTVCLPCGLQGYINIKSISDSYTKLLSEQLNTEDTEEICSLEDIFCPGMVLRCIVRKLDIANSGSISIQLSVDPKHVNQALTPNSLKTGMTLSGCVESVEDHGYLVDIGISTTKAFLPRQAAKDKHNNLRELKVGQNLLCRLDEVKSSARVVRLSVSPSVLSQAFAESSHGWTLSNLQPGLLVRAQIKTVTKHGLILSFLSSFSGQVDFLHLEPEQASSYTKGQEVEACVVYIEPSSRLVGLSLRSFLRQPGTLLDSSSVSDERVGKVVEGCKMAAMHHMSGAVLELPDQTAVFVHKNLLRESHSSLDNNKVAAKPEHSCRILHFSPMEQMFFASLRKSMTASPHFRYQDIEAGQIVEGTVSALSNHGMMVKISDFIKGLVPRTHLSDILLRHPEKKYKEGMTIKCRVLSVEADRKRLSLTRKKTLLESTLPLFLTYSDARKGRISHGYIVSIKTFGCIVRFYNDVRGLVPIGELSSEPRLNPEEAFYIGQVLKVKVLQCEPEKEKLLLSFKAVMQDDSAVETPKLQFDFQVGKKLEVLVLKKSIAGLEVDILPDEFRALLPTMHLSDHISNCPLLWEAIREGDTISSLVCLSKNKDTITLTKKPAMKKFLEEGTLAQDFSDIVVGMQLFGWIKNIMPYGVFVEFPHGLIGLAPKSALCDRFVTDPVTVFAVGQTVVAKVTNLDEEKQRFLVTLKVSEVMSPEGEAQTMLLRGLQERRTVAEMLASREDSDLHEQLAALTVGQKLKLTVDVLNDDGATFKSDEIGGATIHASKHHVIGVNLVPGQKVNAVILHIDLISAYIHVSVLAKLLAKKTSLSEGSIHSVMVQHVDKDFSVVAFDESAHLTLIQNARHLNEMFCPGTEKLKLGTCLTVTVLKPSCEELAGLPLVSWGHVAPKRQHALPKSQAPEGHSFGELVKGTVRSVKPTCVLLALEGGGTGSVHVSEVTEGAHVGSFPTSSVKVGSVVTARVIGGRESTGHRFLPFSHPNFKYTMPELTLLASKLVNAVELKPVKPQEKLSSYKVGEQITCFVSKYNPDKKMLEVVTDPSVTGTVDLLDMITDPKGASHPEKLYKPGQAVSATVLVSSNPRRLSLSLTGVTKLEEGNVTLGIVINVDPHLGLLVKLPFGTTGSVALTDVSDAYRPSPLGAFSKGQLLRCFLLGNETGKWQLSLRRSRLNPEQPNSAKDPEVSSIEDLKAGQLLRGFVKSVGERGIFLRLSRSITGRAQLQKSTNYFVANHKILTKNLPVSKPITTKIISVDKKEELVELSLLPEDTGKPDILPESLGLPLRLSGEMKEKHSADRKRKASVSDSQQGQADKQPKKKKKKKGKTGSDVFFREEEKDEQEEGRGKLAPTEGQTDTVSNKKKTKKIKPENSDSGVELLEEGSVETKPPTQAMEKDAGPARLRVSAGFCWDVGLSSLKPASAVQEADSSDGEDQEEASKPQRKSRHELEQKKKEEEKALVQRETELMDPTLKPQDAVAFERLLVASPNSSLIWLQYMAHHLQATQIEQARNVAERALKTISFREEQEKLNVWVALLNLENMYGTEESLKRVFERALQFCEPMPIYQQLADIYFRSNKTKEADNLYKTMVKRFRQDKAVWLSYGTFLLQRGQSDAASALLQRALQSLPAKESVGLISKFAQMEFQHGDAERGRAMFDKVLSTYPKRTDLWSIFIDLMIKHGSQKDVRALFDRVIHLSVAVKKTKFFFKRYLEYEKKHGTADSIQAVKEKALEFVEAKGTTAAC